MINETFSKMRINKMVIVLVMLLVIINLSFAENAAAQDSLIHNEKGLCESNSKGFNLTIPAYIYSKYSAFGIQGGYQFNKILLRLDLSVIEDYENGKDIWIATPSFGAFLSKDWPSKIRFYEGITTGVESGIKDAFEGQVVFINYVTGAELLLFERKTFFLEFGSGWGFNPKDGAYNGGTVIGGGFKYYFPGKK